MKGILSFCPRKATLLFFPSIWARRRGFTSFDFHQRMLFSEANTAGKWKQIAERVPCNQHIGLLFHVFLLSSAWLQPSSSLSDPRERFASALLQSGYFSVWSFPWKVWYTVCWKVSASKDKGLYWKTNQNIWLVFVWLILVGGVFNFLAASHKTKPF